MRPPGLGPDSRAIDLLLGPRAPVLVRPEL